jgi:osmotically-inducible protein OsmY
MTQTHHVTDHELMTAVVDELAWTPSVIAHGISVDADRGVVTLSGQVDSYPQKQQALRAALRVLGVTAVADEIVVRPATSHEDADIARMASAALERTIVIPMGSVKASVREKVITLTGALAWQYQRSAAHDTVASLPGLVGINNLIVLEPPIIASPEKAKSSITAALVRNARIDARRIHVEVNGSRVTLTGTVTSQVEGRQARRAAWSTPGVTEVDDRLTIAY